MENIDYRVHFVVGISNKLQKIGFERENRMSPQCIHTWVNGTGYISSHYFPKKIELIDKCNKIICLICQKFYYHSRTRSLGCSSVNRFFFLKKNSGIPNQQAVGTPRQAQWSFLPSKP